MLTSHYQIKSQSTVNEGTRKASVQHVVSPNTGPLELQENFG